VFGINAAGQQLPLAVFAALRHRLCRTLFRFLLAGGALQPLILLSFFSFSFKNDLL